MAWYMSKEDRELVGYKDGGSVTSNNKSASIVKKIASTQHPAITSAYKNWKADPSILSALEVLGSPFEAMGQVAGDTILDATGSPALATAGYLAGSGMLGTAPITGAKKVGVDGLRMIDQGLTHGAGPLSALQHFAPSILPRGPLGEASQRAVNATLLKNSNLAAKSLGVAGDLGSQPEAAVLINKNFKNGLSDAVHAGIEMPGDRFFGGQYISGPQLQPLLTAYQNSTGKSVLAHNHPFGGYPGLSHTDIDTWYASVAPDKDLGMQVLQLAPGYRPTQASWRNTTASPDDIRSILKSNPLKVSEGTNLSQLANAKERYADASLETLLSNLNMLRLKNEGLADISLNTGPEIDWYLANLARKYPLK